MKNATNTNIIAILSLILAMAIWGSSFIALKSAMQDINGFTVIFFRMFIASLCFIYFIKSFLKYTYTKSDIKYILLLALFEPCLYFIFEAKALEFTSASQAGMITSLMPLITSLAAGYFLKEIISSKLIIGSLISISGAIWLSLSVTSSIEAPNPFLGNTFELIAMICAAGYAIVTRYLSDKYSALFITAIQSFIGAIFFFPFFLYDFANNEIIINLNSALWILYLGVVVTLGGYGLFNLALTKISASKASIYINLIPIFSLLFAYLILNEHITNMQLIASSIILFGVLISQIKFNFRNFNL